MQGETVHVLLVSIELIVPGARSLKEKRGPLKSLKERARGRFNVSVAEVAHQDKWQRAGLAVCMVGGDRRHLESEVDKLGRLVEEAPGIELVDVQKTWL